MITLLTLPVATAQEVFNQVATHLLKQDKQSYKGKDSACAYRGEEGRQCAAGCLIGDNEYREGWENTTWGRLADNGNVPEQHRLLITDLQQVHDFSSPCNWREKLNLVAAQHGLDGVTC